MAFEGKQFSRYRILQLIGKGGMGEVYLAEDVQVRRQVAAKFIRVEVVQADKEAVSDMFRLFWREATTIAQLDHPHILPLYDHGTATFDGSPAAYLIIPYRPEGSLTTWRREQQKGPLTLGQVAHIIQQAGMALQHAHDHQVMHLDVKPANFLIRSRSSADGYPDLLLSDFGIARLVSTASNASQHAHGTPTYMAPEQWANQPVFASDQYALAVMTYELLTGRPPFQGAALSVMFAHVHEQPRPVHDLNPLLPSTIDFILQRALAKKPEERFPSVAAFAQAFQQAIQSVGETTTQSFLAMSDVEFIARRPASPPWPEPTPLSEQGAFSHTAETVQDLVRRVPNTSAQRAVHAPSFAAITLSPIPKTPERRRPLWVVPIQILLILALLLGSWG